MRFPAGKNFENRLRFDQVRADYKEAHFFLSYAVHTYIYTHFQTLFHKHEASTTYPGNAISKPTSFPSPASQVTNLATPAPLTHARLNWVTINSSPNQLAASVKVMVRDSVSVRISEMDS